MSGLTATTTEAAPGYKIGQQFGRACDVQHCGIGLRYTVGCGDREAAASVRLALQVWQACHPPADAALRALGMNQRYRRHTLRTAGSSRTLSTLVAVGLLLGTVVGTCASHGRVAVPPGAGRVWPRSASAVKMSWRCHGTDNRSMVRALVQNKIVTQESVAAAMTGTDRGDFVADKRSAYVDAPQYIGAHASVAKGRGPHSAGGAESSRTLYVAHTRTGYDATISAPHMVRLGVPMLPRRAPQSGGSRCRAYPQHAFALENLAGHLKPGAKALDVGSGSGYLSVAMALMVRHTH